MSEVLVFLFDYNWEEFNHQLKENRQGYPVFLHKMDNKMDLPIWTSKKEFPNFKKKKGGGTETGREELPFNVCPIPRQE